MSCRTLEIWPPLALIEQTEPLGHVPPDATATFGAAVPPPPQPPPAGNRDSTPDFPGLAVLNAVHPELFAFVGAWMRGGGRHPVPPVQLKLQLASTMGNVGCPPPNVEKVAIAILVTVKF